MSFSGIDSALIKSYLDGNFGLTTKYPNDKFAPPSPKTAWAEVVFLDVGNNPFTLGDNGLDEIFGIMQVNLLYPKDRGSRDVKLKADQFLTQYRTGKSFTHNGVTVDINGCRIGQGFDSRQWWMVPVSIEYSAHIARG